MKMIDAIELFCKWAGTAEKIEIISPLGSRFIVTHNMLVPAPPVTTFALHLDEIKGDGWKVVANVKPAVESTDSIDELLADNNFWPPEVSPKRKESHA